MKRRSKYYPLYAHLREKDQDEITLSFAEVEEILGTKLPKSARNYRAWWSNRSKGAVQAGAWTSAGFQVVHLDLVGEMAIFRKPGLTYHVKRQGNVVLWTGELIKALRQHMGLSQTELADKLGMRQQTISEWETGAYQPRRSTSKYLMMIAEQAGFGYGDEA